MRLHNTLSKANEEFVPIDPKLVKIYTCGPTVYDSAHIGNLSSYIYADMLRRTLNLAGYRTKHVMNITDVDDKTIRESQKKYPNLSPDKALNELTTSIYQAFVDDMRAVGNDINELNFVRATDSMNAIQKQIKFLILAGIAYVADDGIYFDVKKYSNERKYGQLSKIDLPNDMQSRINNDEYDKESAQDFALWKLAKPSEPAWNFDLEDGRSMRGRPGWHIECSAMSVQHLGQPFDIHTGGIDLIFPHHENEIAQSTADGQPEKLANYFVHSGHLMVNGEKMSKSKGNFYTLTNIVQKGYSALDFRMMILQSHYQAASNFTWDSLESAHNRLIKWRAVAELRHQIPDTAHNKPQEAMIDSLILQAVATLISNINTPKTLVMLDQMFDIVLGDANNYSNTSISQLIQFVDENLGLSLEENTPDISDSIKEMIQLRSVVRANGDYEKSDEIRDSLLSQGIKLNDIPSGVTWSRV